MVLQALLSVALHTLRTATAYVVPALNPVSVNGFVVAVTTVPVNGTCPKVPYITS